MKIISESFAFLNKLKKVNFGNETAINCKIGDEGCKAIFRNSKHIVYLEVLDLYGN